MEKVIKKLKEKKGSASTITFIITTLTILAVIALILQMILCSNSYSFISQTSSFLARTLGDQGGIQNSVPNGFNETYITSVELYNTLDEGFEEAGFDDWELEINGRIFSPSTSIKVPEKHYIEITLKGELEPIAKVLGSDRLEIEASRKIVSSFEPRDEGISIVK